MRYERFFSSDLHTHSALCNGKDTHEQMIREAIGREMKTIGFAEHSRVSFAPLFGMTEESERLYQKEIARLRAIYGDRIRIVRGIEQDYYSDLPPLGYDFVIGAVHYVRVDGAYLEVAESPKLFRETVKRYFDGDVYRFLHLYFETVAKLPDKTACEVIAHFDLIAKQNGDGSFFDENDRRYRRYADDALDALIERNMIFEVNTHDFMSGFRRTPYPAPGFLYRIAEKGGRITLASDAVSAWEICAGFDYAAHICRAVGFGSIAVLTPNGWENAPL